MSIHFKQTFYRKKLRKLNIPVTENVLIEKEKDGEMQLVSSESAEGANGNENISPQGMFLSLSGISVLSLFTLHCY